MTALEASLNPIPANRQKPTKVFYRALGEKDHTQ